jgi:hypothetical protein
MIPLNLEIVTRLPLGQPGAVGDLEPAASGAEDLVAGKKLAGRCPAAIFDRTRLYLFRVPMAAGPPQKRNGDLGKRSSTAVQITNSDFLTDASLNRFFQPQKHRFRAEKRPCLLCGRWNNMLKHLLQRNRGQFCECS